MRVPSKVNKFVRGIKPIPIFRQSLRDRITLFFHNKAVYLFCSEIFCKFACCIVLFFFLFHYCYSCCVSRNKPLSDCDSRPEDGFRYPKAEWMFEGSSVADISDWKYEMVDILQNTVVELGWKKNRYQSPILQSLIAAIGAIAIYQLFGMGRMEAVVFVANEYVEIEELLHLVRIHTLAAIQYLRKPAPKAKNKQRKNMCEKAHSFLIHRRLDQFYLSMPFT